jgi:CRP-like cAMP-binding protein
MFLKNQSFLGSLSDAAFDAVFRRGCLKTYAAGDFICRREEQGETLIIIIAGRVKVTSSNPDGKEIVLNFLGPGDMSGEIAMFDGKGRSADAVALETTETFLVYARHLLPVLSAHPQALLEIIQNLCERLRAASSMIEDSSLDMRRRIARGLLRLVLQHGRTSKEGMRLNLAVSQTELGAYLGLSRENVSRQLGQLRNANVIRNEGQELIVTDEPALCEIGAGTWTRRQTHANPVSPENPASPGTSRPQLGCRLRMSFTDTAGT